MSNSPLETADVVRLVMTSSACPVQFEGCLSNDDAIYIRARHGKVWIGTGVDPIAACRAAMESAPVYEGFDAEELPLSRYLEMVDL